MADLMPSRSQETDVSPSYHGSVHQGHQQSSAPFQSQFEYLSQRQQHASHTPPHYGQTQPFDMSAALAGALPHTIQPGLDQRSYGSPDPSQAMTSPDPYHHQQAMYAQQRGSTFDPAMLARAQQHQQQQQHFLGGHYGAPGQIQRQQHFALPGHMAYSAVDAYGYSMGPAQYSHMDPRFAQPSPFLMGGMPAEMAQYPRKTSVDTAPVPNFPRGPPRKPKQSGHALWVGNLPPAAVVTDLKDHFSRDATTDIESVFLIAKSNCAFVNYRTEAACVAAMNRFHDSRFHGVRLVCRLRRGTTPSLSTSTELPPKAVTPPASAAAPPSPSGEPDEESSGPPPIACSPSGESTTSRAITANPEGPPQSDEKVAEKYYIVKSLTAQDLEASVRNGIWATQSHNEQTLNRAYEQAENVYLIFSANKSGEYFGYARMASQISGEPVNLATSTPATEDSTTSSEAAGSPQSIPTPATATAPKGRIIDDSARGTIFWEADHSETDGASPRDSEGSTPDQNWGKQFQIEWLSTSRLPFYRTRGLRNPWNANREVKIARDGTELEPSVGQRLVQMFHRPQQPPQPGMMAPGMSYHQR